MSGRITLITLMSGRIIIWGKGWRFPGFGLPPTASSFDSALKLSWHFWMCHLACWLKIKVQSKPTSLPSLTHLILISFCYVLGLRHSFKSCAPFPPVTPWTIATQVPLSMDFPGKNTGVGSHSFLQEIFLTQYWTQVSCTAGRFITIWGIIICIYYYPCFR